MGWMRLGIEERRRRLTILNGANVKAWRMKIGCSFGCDVKEAKELDAIGAVICNQCWRANLNTDFARVKEYNGCCWEDQCDESEAEIKKTKKVLVLEEKKPMGGQQTLYQTLKNKKDEKPEGCGVMDDAHAESIHFTFMSSLAIDEKMEVAKIFWVNKLPFGKNGFVAEGTTTKSEGTVVFWVLNPKIGKEAFSKWQTALENERTLHLIYKGKEEKKGWMQGIHKMNVVFDMEKPTLTIDLTKEEERRPIKDDWD